MSGDMAIRTKRALPARRELQGARLRLLLPVLLWAVAGCGVDALTGPVGDPGNVEAQFGTWLEQRDGGVAVNGVIVLPHPSFEAALWLDRQDRHEFGGFAGSSGVEAPRRTEEWRLVLTHARPRTMRGDTTVLSYVDHGRVSVGGPDLERVPAPAAPPGGPPVLLENYVRYLSVGLSRVTRPDGGATVQAAPWYARVQAGLPLELATTGSAHAAPTSAAFAVRPFAVLRSLTNGSAITIEAQPQPPVISARRELSLEFDRAVIPGAVIIALMPLDRPSDPLRGLVITPVGPSQTVSIPAEMLQQVKAGGSAARERFRIVVLEIQSVPGVLRGGFAAGGDFALPFVQRSETTVNVVLER
jgi:hypothetical protein